MLSHEPKLRATQTVSNRGSTGLAAAAARGLQQGEGPRGNAEAQGDLVRRIEDVLLESSLYPTTLGHSWKYHSQLIAGTNRQRRSRRRLRHMIYAYPTFRRAIEAALEDLD